MIGLKVTLILLHWCSDYSALWHWGNHNLTAENPQISTRRPETPEKAIGTLYCKHCKQELYFLFL